MTITSSHPNLLLVLWSKISRRRQGQFFMLLGLMLLSALSEIISLGAVLPFLTILISPDRVLNNPFVADMAQAWGIVSADQLALPLTLAFAAAALMAGAVRIILSWASIKLAVVCGSELSVEVYRRTLYQPYRVHLARNSSEVISGITVKVNGVVFGVLLPLLSFVSSIVLMVAIILTLLAINPMVASVAAIGFGTSYAFITWIFRRQINRNGQRIAYEQTQLIKALQEGLGGIRDVLLDGTQPLYCDIYSQADQRLRRAQGNNAFIGASPRYLMEALGMVLISTLAYALSLQIGGIATALPVLGALAIGAQRLLPALQQIYTAYTNIAGNYASLADIIALLDQSFPEELLQPAPALLPFQNGIRFDSVRFQYTGDGPWILDGLNLEIPKGSSVGFVGITGSGKSTTLDLLMGLLMPTEGEILVDDQPINKNCLRAWQRRIAHVPQNIYLADTTMAENIAFGVPPNTIDLDRVKHAAHQAQISDFIESMPEGYQASVGERGVRLSGGQTQRIGIARALYKQADVLVLDEATSALDNTTEQSVMDAIGDLSSGLTLMLIAHRLTTARLCDMIVEVEHGKVVAQGTYEQLLERSPSFRKMAWAK